MSLKITKQKENPLFRRVEIVAEIESDSTPSTAEMEKKISMEISSDPAGVKVRKIKGHFGSKQFSIIAMAYNSEKDKNEIEPKKKEKKAK